MSALFSRLHVRWELLRPDAPAWSGAWMSGPEVQVAVAGTPVSVSGDDLEATAFEGLLISHHVEGSSCHLSLQAFVVDGAPPRQRPLFEADLRIGVYPSNEWETATLGPFTLRWIRTPIPGPAEP